MLYRTKRSSAAIADIHSGAQPWRRLDSCELDGADCILFSSCTPHLPANTSMVSRRCKALQP